MSAWAREGRRSRSVTERDAGGLLPKKQELRCPVVTEMLKAEAGLRDGGPSRQEAWGRLPGSLVTPGAGEDTLHASILTALCPSASCGPLRMASHL